MRRGLDQAQTSVLMICGAYQPEPRPQFGAYYPFR